MKKMPIGVVQRNNFSLKKNLVVCTGVTRVSKFVLSQCDISVNIPVCCKWVNPVYKEHWGTKRFCSLYLMVLHNRRVSIDSVWTRSGLRSENSYKFLRLYEVSFLYPRFLYTRRTKITSRKMITFKLAYYDSISCLQSSLTRDTLGGCLTSFTVFDDFFEIHRYSPTNLTNFLEVVRAFNQKPSYFLNTINLRYKEHFLGPKHFISYILLIQCNRRNSHWFLVSGLQFYIFIWISLLRFSVYP